MIECHGGPHDGMLVSLRAKLLRCHATGTAGFEREVDEAIYLFRDGAYHYERTERVKARRRQRRPKGAA